MPKAVKVLQDEKFKMKEQMADMKKTLVAFKNTIDQGKAAKDQGKAANEDLAEKLDSANKPKDMALVEKNSESCLEGG
jgi:hypothetical protein